MFYYKIQKDNPNKHHLMPDDHPWKRQEEEPTEDGWIACESELEFQSILDSFVLTDYFKALEEEKMLVQQNEQRIFGIELVGKFIDLIGARNLYLASQGISVNIQALSQDIVALKMMVESGVLKTTLGYIGAIKAKYTQHADIYDSAAEDITQFLTERGFL